jgi:hypothetical protein
VRSSSLTRLTASDLRLAELVATLSIATDLGSGQPIGHGQRASVIAARLGQSAGVSEAERRDAYYLAILRYVGCTAAGRWTARFIHKRIALLSHSSSTASC